MPKHRRALCLLYFSTKSFYVNLSNINCHSEVSLSGSSRLASAKVRCSYITTKLSSHFFHGPSARNMHISCTKPSKTADLRPEKKFQLFWPRTANVKKMRLLQENSMKIAPNMLNNIFSALRTPPVPSPAPQNAPSPPTSRPPHAPCAQVPQERFLHSIHCMPCRGQQQREAMEQNADDVGKSVHGGGTFFHGVGSFFHGIHCRTGGAPPERDAMKKNARSAKFSLHRIHFRQGRGQKKGDAT